jgi:hypothetical protein
MNTSKNNKHLPGITVSSDMRDYSKEPFFVKKAEKARAFIAKHGLPKEIKPKKSK